MNDEEKLKETVSKGDEADKILNSALFRDAKDHIEAELFRQFRKTKFKDKDEREEIWRKMQSLDWFVNTFERTVRDGRQAQTLLSRIKQKLAA